MTNPQSYDPSQLVQDVLALLQQRHLTPRFPDGRQAPSVTAASQLLRSLGIQPSVSAEAHYQRSLEKTWGENQDVASAT